MLTEWQVKVKTKLLSLGGTCTIPDNSPAWEDFPPIYCQLLLEFGKARDGKGSILQKGLQSNCHVHAWTGFALSADDGMWRPHYWAINDKDQLIETTEKRKLYFGRLLSPDEAKWILAHHG
jgi:hypothetical protein